jgi:erythromycin esterase
MNIFKITACATLLMIANESVSIEKQSYEDNFAKLAHQISDKRFVAIGEQSHGAGNVFDFKAQFIQYMHQKHNFDVFVIESGLFDVDMLYRNFLSSGDSIEQNSPDNIFYMYANSSEISPLFSYIEQTQNTARPLILVGLDSQHTGSLSNKHLLNDLSKQLPEFNTEFTKEQWDSLRKEFELVLKVKSIKPNDKNLILFKENLSALSSHAKQIKHRRSFWHRVIAGLKAQTFRQWQIEDLRSHEMGNNLVWIANQYPGKKVLIWAHTFHVEKNLVHETENAGKVMLKEFGDDYFVTHITGSSGKYVDFIDMKTKPVKESQTDSFEVNISKDKCTVCVVNLDTLKQPEQIEDILYFNYTNSVPFSQYKHKWDSVIYFEEVTPSNRK